MISKLGIVLVLVLFSLVRTTFIVFLNNGEGFSFFTPLSRIVVGTYASTAFVLIAVLWLAVGLAHG